MSGTRRYWKATDASRSEPAKRDDEPGWAFLGGGEDDDARDVTKPLIVDGRKVYAPRGIVTKIPPQ